LNVEVGYDLQTLNEGLGFIVVLLREEIQVYRDSVAQVQRCGTSAGKIKGPHPGFLAQLCQEPPGVGREGFEKHRMRSLGMSSTSAHKLAVFLEMRRLSRTTAAMVSGVKVAFNQRMAWSSPYSNTRSMT
jgi:hypothetical protein